jgi:serine/threonine protein kinase
MDEELRQCPRCGSTMLPEDGEGECTPCALQIALSEKPSLDEEMTGTTLGSYEILEELGRGGMGVVYKAHDPSLNRTAALKVLAPWLADDADFIIRFQQEAQAAARLAHPNIVPIYAFGDEAGCCFFAMEYVQGVDLADYLKEHQKLDSRQALDLAARLASALETAHAEGVIHRDIKPQNIMIDNAGRVRVLDFGLAKLLGPETVVTAKKAFLGTPAYAPPEQCENKELDARSDLYSLGVTLYECLSGRLPYQADSAAGLI